MRLAQALFFLNAAIWVAIALASAWRAANDPAAYGGAGWIVPALVSINAAIMLFLGFAIAPRSRLYTLAAILFLLGNILLTLTDEFGLIDALTLALDLALLAVLAPGWRASSGDPVPHRKPL